MILNYEVSYVLKNTYLVVWFMDLTRTLTRTLEIILWFLFSCINILHHLKTSLIKEKGDSLYTSNMLGDTVHSPFYLKCGPLTVSSHFGAFYTRTCIWMWSPGACMTLKFESSWSGCLCNNLIFASSLLIGPIFCSHFGWSC